VFKSVLDAMLDLRLRLPPMYDFCPKSFKIDPATGNVKIVLTNDLFSKEKKTVNFSHAELLFKSPEELTGLGKSLTTPFWVLGCQMYVA